MIVRNMLPQEIDATVILCGYYSSEANIGDEYDENAVIETIRQHSIHPEYFWFNAYEGQRPVGLVAGCITRAPWSKKEFYVHIELIYLLDSHRSFSNFKQLLDKVEEFARSVNAKKITAGDIGIDIERTKKLYNHFGFTEGLWMSKEITQ